MNKQLLVPYGNAIRLLFYSFLGNKISLYFSLVFVLLFADPVMSQTVQPTLFLWDTFVGCTEGANATRKTYEELIAEGLCLEFCKGTTVNYEFHSGGPIPYTNTQWTVVGGTILFQDDLHCRVKWSSTLNAGSIAVSTTTPTGALNYPALCVDLKTSPTASFQIVPQNTTDTNLPFDACRNQTIYFTNTSSSNGGTALEHYYWDFGDGSTSAAFEPTHAYLNEGTFNVRLVVVNSCSCKDVFTRRVTVKKRGVDISCASVVCQGQKTFYSLPPDFNDCEKYDWSVVGGTIVSRIPYGRIIEVVWTPTSPERPDTTGFGYVTFNPSDCRTDCYEPRTIKIPIIASQGIIIGDASLCEDTQTGYKLPQWPTTDFVWEIVNSANTNAAVIFTDQRNEVLVNPGSGSGTFVLKCTYQNTLLNCGGTATKTITVKSDSDIDGPTNLCLSTPGASYTTASGLSGTWKVKKLPSGSTVTTTGESVTPNFATAGNYSITLSGNNFCAEKVLQVGIKGNEIPLIASFSGNTVVCPASPTTFTFSNTVPNTIIGWEVDGGHIAGSTFGNTVSVTFDYPYAGTYKLRIWRQSTNEPVCKSDSLTIPLNLISFPGGITGTNITCASSYQTYSYVMADADSYSWTISPASSGSVQGSNTGSTATILWNEFATSQNVNVVLAIKKCNITEIKTFAVTIGSPQITINPIVGNICSGSSKTFSLSSSPALNNGTGSITWDFGDGITASGTTASHVFNVTDGSPSNFTVKLTVQNPNGCNSTIVKTVNVNVALAPSAKVTNPAGAIACNMSDVPESARKLSTSLTTGTWSTHTIVWYKNNVIIPGENTPNYEVSALESGFGNYYAVVSNLTCALKTNVVVFEKKCSDEQCTISPPANLTLNTIYNCGTVTATATYSGSPTITWGGDPVSSSSTQATYKYPIAGNYSISYTATYIVNGQPCKAVKSANVLVPYIPDLKYNVICGSGGTYNVKLLDYSNYSVTTPITVWEFKVNNVIKPQVGANGDTTTTRNLSLAPGTYNLLVNISGSGYPTCSKQVTLVLPAFPVANFDISSGPYCEKESIQFTIPPSSIQPGDTYLWDFGDNTTNTQKNPNKVFSTAGEKTITLVVINKYGCISSKTKKTIKVVIKNMNGTITPSSAIGCTGSTISLSYLPAGGTQIPTGFQWMNDNLPILGPGGTSNPFLASTEGSYWVRVMNTNSCFEDIYNKVGVSFVNPPEAKITGFHNICNGQAVKFTGSGGDSVTLQYLWTLGGITLGTNAILEHTPSGTGTYIYTLQVKEPLEGGLFCTNTTTHELTVYDPPQITDLYMDNLVCNPFSFKLHATADSPGTFLWSNGDSGPDITVTHGGAYQVIFTSESGCKTSLQIDVPKSLESYMWIFPSGCYTFCDKFETGTLLGPSIEEFDNWSWRSNGVSVLAGTGEVSQYNIPSASATYNMALGNAQCTFVSPDLNIRVDNCGCVIDATLNSITAQTSPFNQYVLSYHIGNNNSQPISVTISTSNNVGIFQPSTVSVPPGGGNFTFSLLPDQDFQGGSAKIRMNSINSERRPCFRDFSVMLPSFAVSRPAGVEETNKIENSLLIVPNPVIQEVKFVFEIESIILVNNPIIELFDPMGRLLDYYIPKTEKGSWLLDLGHYAAGNYVVTLKENGKILLQKNVLVTH
ncbi:PKD domain-containing protein [Flavobacterium cerinum]|uniref:PKD domain-containing protein n=1 Tax=Flavobacterium cerinum TaxID=2502784 RepID=A0A444GZY7_9FLAO|nr:PKD domain-containing protein [Flavobacterium cerinum]RWW96615.1 PKD domain-containing protein [Flavobacterium cerinum]